MAFFEVVKSPRPLSSRILGTLGAWLLKLFIPTYRWRQVGELPKQLLTPTPVVFTFWHNQQLLMTSLFWRIERHKTSKGLVALASTHRDGQIIAQIVENFGLMSTAGSSRKGAHSALLALGRGVKAGYDVALAPDGPKGPIFEVKQGIILLSRKFGIPIVPIAYATRERTSWRFNKAWDKMFLPKPFANVSWTIGEPIWFSTEHDLADATRIVQAKLDQLNAEVVQDVAR